MRVAELAKLAGVCKGTASQALSGKGRISPQTRKRVLDLAKRFGYEPHGPAAMLASGKTGIIGIVPTDADGLSLTAREDAMIRGVAKALADKDVDIILVRERRGAAPRVIARKGVDDLRSRPFRGNGGARGTDASGEDCGT